MHGAAFAPREDLARPFVETSREGFRIALDVSAYSLIALARGAAPLMEKRGGGSILTLTYLGSERVFPNYNVMGVAKAALEVVGALSRRRARPAEHPRQRDLGRTDQDARGVGHRRLLEHPAGLPRSARRCGATSRRREVADAALFLLGPAGAAITGESADGRRRLPHRGDSEVRTAECELQSK